MSEIIRLRTRAQIDEEAATWAWRMDSPTVSAAGRAAFDSWLQRDPRHRRAYEELSQVWDALDGLAEAKRDEKIATFTAQSESSTARRPPGRHAAWAAMAAAVAAVLILVGIRPGHEIQTVATAVGQQRSVTLSDGSVVMLNTNTIIETDLRSHSREIYLRKGEAHFKVAHDRSRPFFVHAGDAVVRAVGTEFEVRVLGDRHVDVVVNEGQVEVRPHDPAQPTASRIDEVRSLRAGQQLSTATRDYAVTPVSTEQLASTLAWREGAIVFEGEPLSQAIAEIERYTDARVVVSDASTASLRVGGRFRTNDLQEFFDALQTALPIAVRRSADGVIFIDPRR